jgi:hypothetical protein
MAKIKFGIPLPIGGIDKSKPGEYLDSRNTPDCSDVYINRSVIDKRPGTEALGISLGERILALAELEVSGTTSFLRIGLTKVEKLDKIDNTWDNIANVPLTGTVTDRVDYAFPELNGSKIIVYTNGRDPIRKYTGAGIDANLGGTPPLSKYVVAFGGYLLLLHVTDGGNIYGKRVQWCDTGDIETWGFTGNAGAADLLEDPDDITGGGLWGDYVTIHKESAIYVGYLIPSENIFRFDRKATGVGAACFGSIQSLPTGEQIFLARDGFHLFNGSQAPLIPSPITEELRESMAPAYLYKTWSRVFPELDEYWCGVAIGSQTEPDTVYKYKYLTQQIYKDSRLGICTCGTYINTKDSTWDDDLGTWDSDPTSWDNIVNLSLQPLQAFGSSTGETTRRSTVFRDNNQPILSWWISKDITGLDLGIQGVDDDNFIRWQEVRLWAKGNALTVEYSTDAGYSWKTVKTVTLTSDYPTDAAPISVYLDVASTRIRFRFSNSDLDGYFSLKKFKPIGILRESR